uniref:ATP synthase CF0 subunit I n=1 Tax=Wildemania schizophylla TaxID=1134705 RepID=A0A126G1G6_WILSC|nr:ATP synthase CF0 subunit I [Wildemania schizophylla]AKS28387.1 ATP synthase CF0 subunit I [Wildemania schizophylla]
MNNIVKIPQIITILSEHSSKHTFGFNSDIFEANVINILLLLFGLVYVLKQFLGSSLNERQAKVLAAIQESEERLEQASSRLSESEKQLAQTQIIIEQIQKEAQLTAEKVRSSILAQGQLDIERLAITGKSNIETAEQQIRRQIQQKITSLALRRVTLQLESQINSEMQLRIIDNNIAKLGDTL